MTQTTRVRTNINLIYHKVISIPEWVKSVKALSEALKNLIGLERQAYDIDVLDQQTKRDILAHNKSLAGQLPKPYPTNQQYPNKRINHDSISSYRRANQSSGRLR